MSTKLGGFPCAVSCTLVMLTAGAAPDTSPAPGEEVMRPTQRGLRMTPGIARGLTRVFMREAPFNELSLTEQQEARVTDIVAGRILAAARQHGEQAQPLLEYGVEIMIQSEGANCFTPEMSREFGARMAPLLPMIRELLGGIPDAVDPELTPDQRAQIRESLSDMNRMLDRTARRFQKMADGRYEGRNPFAGLNNDPEGSPERKTKSDRAMMDARQYAETQVRQAGVSDWRLMLDAAAAACRFDPAQRARGQAILNDYIQRAAAVKTAEWRQRLRRNYVWMFAGWNLGEVPRQPWAYRLERQHRLLMKPLEELSRSFARELRSLATAEQWATAVRAFRQLAEEHGMPPTERPDEPGSLLPFEAPPGDN